MEDYDYLALYTRLLTAPKHEVIYPLAARSSLEAAETCNDTLFFAHAWRMRPMAVSLHVIATIGSMEWNNFTRWLPHADCHHEGAMRFLAALKYCSNPAIAEKINIPVPILSDDIYHTLGAMYKSELDAFICSLERNTKPTYHKLRAIG